MNGDEYYLPEVCHGGRKWSLRGDVSRVARVMVHLGEREQSVTQCLGGDWWMKNTVCIKKGSHQSLHLDAGIRAENICLCCMFSFCFIHGFSLSLHLVTSLLSLRKRAPNCALRTSRSRTLDNFEHLFEGHGLYACRLNCDKVLKISLFKHHVCIKRLKKNLYCAVYLVIKQTGIASANGKNVTTN